MPKKLTTLEQDIIIFALEIMLEDQDAIPISKTEMIALKTGYHKIRNAYNVILKD